MVSRTTLFIVYRAPDAPNRISLKSKSVTGKESAQMVTSVPVVTDAPLELSRKNGHEAMENLLFSQAATSKKPDQLACGIDNADGADAVMRLQFVDALDRRILRNEKLRVD